MPWEPFRLRDPVMAEGIHLGPPPLAQPAGRSSIPWWERGQGAQDGVGTGGGPEERATSGKEAHVGFSSLIILRGRPSWPAWMGAQGCWPLCLAWQHDHFKLNGSGAFSTFTVFWDYHLCRVLRHFITPRVTPFPGSSDVPPLLPQPWQHSLPSVSAGLPVLTFPINGFTQYLPFASSILH